MKDATPSARSIKPLSKILLCLTGLFVGLGFAELGLRLLNFKRPLTSEWMLHSPHRIPEEDLITIDSRYVKESYYKPFQSLGRARIGVALGDSFTIGFPVESNDSWTAVLERELFCRVGDVRILNVGMGDTGPDQHLKLFTKHVLPRIKPGIVIWQFFINDTSDNLIKAVYQISEGDALIPISAQDHWMLKRQVFYKSLPLPSIIKKNSYVIHLILRQFERLKEASVSADKKEWARHKIELAIDRMNELSKSYNFKVYYVLVAPQSFYQNDPFDEPLRLDKLEYAKLHSILKKQPTFIEGWFRPGDMGDTSNFVVTLFDDGSRDPAPLGQRHFNEKGYRFLGKKIAERLLQDSKMQDDLSLLRSHEPSTN